jgi:hypothetical protein
MQSWSKRDGYNYKSGANSSLDMGEDRSLANTGKACTHGLTGNPGRIKRRKKE